LRKYVADRIRAYVSTEEELAGEIARFFLQK
jgi:hypothetical protein